VPVLEISGLERVEVVGLAGGKREDRDLALVELPSLR
jgi:hypothetical protein